MNEVDKSSSEPLSAKRGRRRRFAEGLKCSLLDFLTHTSMHGTKYIGEDDRSIIERLFWITAISVGIGATGFMVLNIYVRYTASPTVSVLHHTHYPTWRLPFPAITLCNNNRILRSRAENFVTTLTIPQNMNQSTVLDNLKLLASLHNPQKLSTADLAEIQDILDFNRLSVHDVMLQLGQPCQEMLERCSWQNEVISCGELFKPSKSNLGFCCSFNYVGAKGAQEIKQDGPLHTRLYGQRMGITVLMNPGVDDYFASSFVSTGVAAHIHDPYIYPSVDVLMKMVPINKEVIIPIRMSSRICSEDVAALPMWVRQCNFQHENHLSFFSNYLDDNCITECRMNYSLKQCACIPYYYPNNGQYRTCDLMDADCRYNNFELLHTFKPGVESEKKLIVEEHRQYLLAAVAKDNSMACNCPSQCEGVSFEARVSWGDFAAARDSVNQLFGPETNDTNRILLHVFLESNFSQVSKRDIATSKSVLLALLGGICSLFLGCSFVTPLELTYFFSVRLPGFFRNDPQGNDKCPASPRAVHPKQSANSARIMNDIRDIRFPSVRRQNNHTIPISTLTGLNPGTTKKQ